MQTFLPHTSFDESAKVLDRQRLGKQRVEVLQLLRALNGETTGWRNHPACVMWRGYEVALANYGLAICKEWIRRGYKDTCFDKIFKYNNRIVSLPPWIGDNGFHASHRSNLLRKDPIHYGQFGWSEPNDLPYIWPIHNI